MSRWIPLFSFAVLSGTLLFLVVVELRNYFEFPTVDRFAHPRGWGRLTLYHKGASPRAADVFYEPGDGTIEHVAALYYEGKDRAGNPRPRFEELGWTRDGSGLYATDEHGRLLWVYELESGRLLRADRYPEAAKAVFAADGGPGEPVTEWFVLGGKEGARRLWSWETTRYEKSLGGPPESPRGP